MKLRLWRGVRWKKASWTRMESEVWNDGLSWAIDLLLGWWGEKSWAGL